MGRPKGLPNETVVNIRRTETLDALDDEVEPGRTGRDALLILVRAGWRPSEAGKQLLVDRGTAIRWVREEIDKLPAPPATDERGAVAGATKYMCGDCSPARWFWSAQRRDDHPEHKRVSPPTALELAVATGPSARQAEMLAVSQRYREAVGPPTAVKMNPDDPRHGRPAGYRYGCRCERCREAHRQQKALRAAMARDDVPGGPDTAEGVTHVGA